VQIETPDRTDGQFGDERDANYQRTTALVCRGSFLSTVIQGTTILGGLFGRHFGSAHQRLFHRSGESRASSFHPFRFHFSPNYACGGRAARRN
jgi:hypothetical protein